MRSGVGRRLCCAVGLMGMTVGMLIGCGSEDEKASFGPYVAIGDSFTAAPGVEPALGSGDCGRSTANYPQLAAKILRAPLTDVSCSGATAVDLVQGQQVTGQVLTAQVEAVTSATELVTIGAGGNDLDLIGLATSCVRTEPSCIDKIGRVQSALAELPQRIEDVVTAVRERAPKATVVVVDYPTIISASAPCDALPLPEQIITAAVDVNAQLSGALSRAAASSEALFLKLYDATAEHGLCGSEPWIAGLDGEGAQPFHPTIDEQRFVAKELTKLVS